ncbi:MAG: mechanosensitive ion channel family protein [Bacteroidota bacterium]
MINRQVVRFYDKALDWALVFGPKLILAILLLVFGLWAIRLIRRKVISSMDKKDVHSSLRPFFESLIFTALYVALFFFIMQVLGIQLTVFAAVIAAFGAAAGLALSGTLQNFASGILILLLKPFIIGDNIIAQGFEGTVTSIRIFYTVITTYDKRTVVVPNGKLSNEVIVNITRIGSRRLDIELQFNFNTDLAQVKAVLQEAISSSADVLKDPVARIGVSGITENGYKVMSNMWLNAHGFEDARMILNERLVNALKESGVVVPLK